MCDNNIDSVYEKILSVSKKTQFKDYLFAYDDPIMDNVIMTSEFNKYKNIEMDKYNLTFNNNFDNIKRITGAKVIINGVMDNLKYISFNNLVINNKLSQNCELFMRQYDTYNFIHTITFNYEIDSELIFSCYNKFIKNKLYDVINDENNEKILYNGEIHFINNTNKEIKIKNEKTFIKDEYIILNPKSEIIKKFQVKKYEKK